MKLPDESKYKSEAGDLQVLGVKIVMGVQSRIAAEISQELEILECCKQLQLLNPLEAECVGVDISKDISKRR